jgi:ABC-type transport system involved in cytochrome bd biosynthesis fused ATPase/permease subunit
LLKDAPLLILDEPTANLDPLNEQSVLDSIQAICLEHNQHHAAQDLKRWMKSAA